ncbi:hypothetical protein [Hyperthermus butylicus]|uniref:Uncharacterized protein n=1 Tax=Hyperthermus butylicus (strain DSM 5456 / JCM 9403 / PLM1-5) TaxID=415426 RepID=A2BJK6_HYPBU|nr:hypothetical protein [Hyperthermus butylicus]ABM80167.1 hypothetical protein Hbut_0295 [Hyperthermus butylicus DSM 5456]
MPKLYPTPLVIVIAAAVLAVLSLATGDTATAVYAVFWMLAGLALALKDEPPLLALASAIATMAAAAVIAGDYTVVQKFLVAAAAAALAYLVYIRATTAKHRLQRGRRS